METVKSKKTGVFKIVPTGGGLASASEFSVEYIAGMAANVQFRPKVCDCTVFVCLLRSDRQDHFYRNRVYNSRHRHIVT